MMGQPEFKLTLSIGYRNEGERSDACGDGTRRHATW